MLYSFIKEQEKKLPFTLRCNTLFMNTSILCKMIIFLCLIATSIFIGFLFELSFAMKIVTKVYSVPEWYQYCSLNEIKKTSSSSNQKPLLLKNIKELLKQRITAPNPCNRDTSKNKENYLENLNTNLDDQHNLVPFINRCKVKAMYGNKDLYELLASDTLPFGYIHVYKSGGTTITNSLLKMQENKIIPECKHEYKCHVYIGVWRAFYLNRWFKGENGQKYDKMGKSKAEFYEFLKQIFLFSYVRDPVSRYLSAFFEIEARNDNHDTVLNTYDSLNYAKKNGTELFKEMTNVLKHRMQCEFANAKNANDIWAYDIYWDNHLHPQMFFLLNDNWDHYPLNYVGNMEDMQSSYYSIVDNFVFESEMNRNDEYFKEEKDKWFEDYYKVERDRHSNEYQQRKTDEGKSDFLKYIIDQSSLNDNVIRDICDIYWLDYICLPFDIPKQCNITELLIKHYGHHVVYQDCYN